MKEVLITKAEVSIHVLKLDNKSVTKAVFRQIPTTSELYSKDHVLGYVAIERPHDFLINREGILYKFNSENRPKAPGTYTEENNRLPLTHREYLDWCGYYEVVTDLLEGCKQLYIAT